MQFQRRSHKAFQVYNSKTLWSLIDVTALYRTHQPCQTVCAKCVKLLSGKDCEILVLQNVAFAVDFGIFKDRDT